MDPSTITGIGLMLGVAHASKDAVTDIAKRLCGPTADKAGNRIANRFFGKQSENIIETMAESLRLLKAARLKPQPVPGRILIPLLQSSAIEDDKELRRRWAALLANAASPTPANQILPAYAEILRQLTPIEAQILDFVYDVAKWKMKSGRVPKIQVFRAISREEVLDKFKVDVHTYNLLMTDLHRLGLIDGGQLTKMYKLAPVSTTFLHFELTRLGTNFVRSCLPPLVVAKLALIDT